MSNKKMPSKNLEGLPVWFWGRHIKGPRKLLEAILKVLLDNGYIKRFAGGNSYLTEGYAYRIKDNELIYHISESGLLEEIKEKIANRMLHYIAKGYDYNTIDAVVQMANKIEDLEYYDWFDWGELYPEYFVSKEEQKNKLEKVKQAIKKKKKNSGEDFKIVDIDRILSISIEDVLDKVGIQYKKSGDNLLLYEDGKLTDGWRGNLKLNIIKDFSRGTRPQGNPFVFIKKYYGFTDDETFEWFKQNFFNL